MKEDNKITKEGMMEFLKALTSSMGDVSKYQLYSNYIESPRGIFEDFFTALIQITEGASCSVDKASHIASCLFKAIKENKNISTSDTYASYKANGGDLGNINEDNTDMNKLTYWSSSTIKDTDQALELFISTIKLDYQVIQNYLIKNTKKKP